MWNWFFSKILGLPEETPEVVVAPLRDLDKEQREALTPQGTYRIVPNGHNRTFIIQRCHHNYDWQHVSCFRSKKWYESWYPVYLNKEWKYPEDRKYATFPSQIAAERFVKKLLDAEEAQRERYRTATEWEAKHPPYTIPPFKKLKNGTDV